MGNLIYQESILISSQQPNQSFCTIQCGFQSSYDFRNPRFTVHHHQVKLGQRPCQVKGDELADTLVKETAQIILLSSFIPFLTFYLKAQLKQNSISKCLLKWHIVDIACFSYNFLPTVSTKFLVRNKFLILFHTNHC